MQRLSQPRIRDALSRVDAGIFGLNAQYYPCVRSSNDAARKLAEHHTPEGTLVITDEQTAGRGRHGRKWLAPAGSSLLMSVVFRPSLPVEQVNRLVMACGLAVAEGCEAAAGIGVDIKWPNDLQTGGKKLAGILSESTVIGELLEWVIVGIGINVHQVYDKGDPLAATATSLKMASGKDIDRAELLGIVLEKLNYWYRQIAEPVLLITLAERCVTIGRWIQVTSGSNVYRGLAESILETGELVLRTGAGELLTIAAGEAKTTEYDGQA
nr:biotin--[acetyl-CoA-carboxylase] ligase [Anaerolineae bacterium]